MTKSNSISALLVALVAALLLFVPAILLTSKAGAQEAEQQPVQVSEPQDSQQAESYTFTAQPGDSYTKIARKAVQIYGIDNGVNLSGEQIVFTETNLTLEAGSPDLNEGQEVSINKDTIKSWVEKAQALSDSQQAAWTVYANNVDFNTNNVGE